VISGWWFNEIQTHFYQQRNYPDNHFQFYNECRFLDSAKINDSEIYYLPEQNLYNDEMFQQHCTDSLAKPFPEK
ncbi:MAG TPA: hypothetical protein VFJ43_02475, partial [Bacteroidia bacterium]|nr:hypothetical protein [Bacteroidia bacterium]